jgi:hypothetical protein
MALAFQIDVVASQGSIRRLERPKHWKVTYVSGGEGYLEFQCRRRDNQICDTHTGMAPAEFVNRHVIP